MTKRELVIVGGGPAGMAAASAAQRCGVKDILLLERDQFLGGILNQCIHTGFGLAYFKEILTGPEYAERFIDTIEAIPTIEVSLRSFVIRLTKDRHLTFLKPGHMVEVQAGAVIIATGCRERTREMIHLPGTRPSGIYSAGLAQKLINTEGLLPGKDVVIVGSGDIGLIMARRFVLEGARVKAVIEIQKTTKGLMRNVVQCLHDFDIPLLFQHTIVRIYGKDRVEGVEVGRVDDAGTLIPDSRVMMPCDTVLISAGLIPENELLEMAGADIDKKTNTPRSEVLNETSLPGVFVCGNACKIYDLVDWVTQDSHKAGTQAAAYLGYKVS